MYIEAKGIRKTYLRVEHRLFSSTWYGDVEALAGVDFDVSKGEFVSIVGPSGCGKTTLLDILAGLQVPSEGRVNIDGKELTGPRRETSMVFQQSGLLPWRTVLENVLFGLQLKKRERLTKEDREWAIAQIEMVGLGSFQNAHPRHLSGGMQQRVGIARALATRPDILLMDEPFGALDAQTRLILQTQLLQLLERSEATVVFITHDVDEAVYLSDRVAVMSPRPSTICKILETNFPKKRRWECGVKASPEFQELRRDILNELGIAD